MTLEQLRALDAVVRYGSIRAASNQLYKTAPAISSLIKNLEADVGITLLSRDRYRPELTPEGEIFYQKAKTVLISADELKALSQRIAGHKELIVNIAINAVCPLKVILETLQQIEHCYPETQINVSTEQMGGAIEQLKSGHADIAITTATGIDSGNMEAVPLLSIPVIPVAHADHPMVQNEQLISTQEAKQFTQVIVRDSSRRAEKQTLDVIEGGRHCMVTDFTAKKAVITAGLGWGGLPEYLIADELKQGSLKQLNVENFEVRHSQQFMIRRLDSGQGIVSQDVWQTLEALFAE